MPATQYKIDTASVTRTPTWLNVLTRSDMKNDEDHAAFFRTDSIEREASKKGAANL